MNVDGYRYNYEDFYEKSKYQMSIIMGEQPQLKVPIHALCEFFPFFSLSLCKKL